MEHAVLILPIAVVLTVLWPAFLQAMAVCVKIYRRLNAPRVITCPATMGPAALELAVSFPSALLNSRVADQYVRRCSRWPQHAQCDQSCLRQIEGRGKSVA